MDPLITSSLISAGADLAGGLFGRGGDSPAKQSSKMTQAAIEGEIRYLNEVLPGKMKKYEEVGIHPLIAMGLSPNSSPPVSAFGGGSDGGSRTRDTIANMGQGISRAVSSTMEREDRELAKTSAKLGLENQALQNERLRSEIALMHAPGSPPGFSPTAGSDADARYPHQKQLPIGVTGAQPRYLPTINADGSVTRVTNPNAGDNEFLMGWDFLTATLPDELKSLIARTVKRHGPRNVRKHIISKERR